MKRPPSEYLRRFTYDTIGHDDRIIAQPVASSAPTASCSAATTASTWGWTIRGDRGQDRRECRKTKRAHPGQECGCAFCILASVPRGLLRAGAAAAARRDRRCRPISRTTSFRDAAARASRLQNQIEPTRADPKRFFWRATYDGEGRVVTLETFAYPMCLQSQLPPACLVRPAAARRHADWAFAPLCAAPAAAAGRSSPSCLADLAVDLHVAAATA